MTRITRETSQNGNDDAAETAAERHTDDQNGQGISQSSRQLPGRSLVRDQVMLEYQRTSLEMASRFLQTQQRVMLAYLQGGASAPQQKTHVPNVVSTPQSRALPGPASNVSGSTGHLDLQRSGLVARESKASEHGQASISGSQPEYGAVNDAALAQQPSRLPTISALQQSHVDVTPAVVTAASAPSQSTSYAEQLIEQLIDIVSQRTGYPPEMLDPSLDLEADLGIDSIKRVEILNSFQKLLPEEKKEGLQDGIEKLAAVKSLQGIMDWIRSDFSSITADVSTVASNFSSMELTPMELTPPQSEAHATSAQPSRGEGRGPRLHGAQVTRNGDSKIDFLITMDRHHDLYLNDHTFDGVPVMPMAVCVELMCEAAVSLYPEWSVSSVNDMEIPAGIVFESGKKDIVVCAEVLVHSAEEAVIATSVCTEGKFRRTHFKSKVKLTPKPVPIAEDVIPAGLPARFSLPEFNQPAEPPSSQYIYERVMFHGPLFQGIKQVNGLGTNYIAGQLQPRKVDDFLASSNGEDWILNPALLDSAMQMAGVWGRHFLDVTLLPAGFKSIHIAGTIEGDEFDVVVSVPTDTTGFELKCDLAVFNSAGKMVLLIERLKGIGTKSLNRLSSKG